MQVLRDNVKARREVDLHWRASNCRHIVNIVDVYENVYGGNRCLLVVMEWKGLLCKHKWHLQISNLEEQNKFVTTFLLVACPDWPEQWCMKSWGIARTGGDPKLLDEGTGYEYGDDDDVVVIPFTMGGHPVRQSQTKIKTDWKQNGPASESGLRAILSH
ncbi:hypothetical protein V5799_024904 [Amblyomma americanum]|uniref:non-specific serine/threonine protein kinase n=1 Tax=Amblyomma americanum TaxID=6943 RepID=A0AAQ4EAR8_AMBAM